MVMQQTIFTRRGTDRIMKYAFELAKTRPKGTSPRAPNRTALRSPCRTGTNASKEMAAQYPDIKTTQYHVDILTAHFMLLDWFDVVVGSNLFGDILSDLRPAWYGNHWHCASGNLNPEREFPSCLSLCMAARQTFWQRHLPTRSDKSGRVR